MEYIVISESNIKDLTIAVNHAIDEGYVPAGGVCYSRYEFLQAMIKPKKA